MNQMPIIQTLLAINTAIIEAESSDEVLKVIFDSALALFHAEACSLSLLDESGALTQVFWSGAPKDQRLPLAGQGLGRWVMTHDKGAVSNAPSTDPRLKDNPAIQEGKGPKSILCVPLKLHNNIIGVIQLFNSQKQAGFSQDDLTILTYFAGMAGTAIKKTEYVQAVKNASFAYRAEERRRNRLVGFKSKAMQEVIKTARKAAESNSTVLLMSESGTGKELTARSIHRWSPRAEGPFIAVNCVALTPELLASELFGHEKGAFTGATAKKIGKFELADGGTIFLDEIGELTGDLQAKLLRVLQEREFQRVGGNQDIRVDVRIIAATNRDLARESREGRFREDLFYRLNVVTIKLAPLRERREDLPELMAFFLSRYCRETGRPLVKLAPEVEHALLNYRWPGNIRQLQNTIERAVVLSRGPMVTQEVLPPELCPDLMSSSTHPPLAQHLAKTSRPAGEDIQALNLETPLAQALEWFQKEKVLRALKATAGNQAQAAKHLGLQPSNLSRLIKKLNLKPERPRWWEAP